MSPSRRAAFDVLLAVEAGGLTSTLLPEATAGLESRDAALATELVLGTLRRRAQLHALIGQRTARPAEALDAQVRVALEMGAYQLRFLDRIPAHAAVAESVELVKRAGKRSAAGFVNAVLRRLPPVPASWPSAAVGVSMPEWILGRWIGQFGREAALAAARAALAPPLTYVRVPAGSDPPAGLEATPVPGCYIAPSGAPAGLRIMDIGAQAIVPLLDLRAGHRLLDLCVAPGNKTALALETPGIRAVACDASPRRLRQMLLPEGAVDLLQVDAARPLPFGPVFDRILVDAPCSGTGTLARHPEIKWRLSPQDIERHAARQREIVGRALQCLRPGGLLVYATCSLEAEENQRVLEGLPVERWLLRLPGRDPGDGFQAAIVRG